MRSHIKSSEWWLKITLPSFHAECQIFINDDDDNNSSEWYIVLMTWNSQFPMQNVNYPERGSQFTAVCTSMNRVCVCVSLIQSRTRLVVVFFKIKFYSEIFIISIDHQINALRKFFTPFHLSSSHPLIKFVTVYIVCALM